MFSRKITLIIVAVILCGLVQKIEAQTSSVFTAGLSQPTKIMLSTQGNLLVTETLGPPNSGRVSIIDRAGRRRTLIDGLPSGISPEGPSGPTGLDMRDRTLFVAIGEGDGIVAGPIPGTLLANPNPLSPLISSVLAIEFSENVEMTTQGFSLSMADQLTIAAGGVVTLNDGTGNTITVKLLADFPNFIPNPMPQLPANVRNSNPFALVVGGGNDLFVVNAGLNMVVKVNTASGNWQTLTTFPPRPNPLPFGPPVIDAVPDGIRFVDGRLLVTLLTGFPFVPGLSEVRRVDPVTGINSAYISGRSSAIDVLGGSSRQHYVLEFSTNFLANEPGRLLLFQSPGSAPVVVASGLISPSGMVRDAVSGDIFITENFTGRIIRVVSY